MAPATKRKAALSGTDVIDLTSVEGREASDSRPSKVPRVAPPVPDQNSSNGQRFGEDAAFVSLSQASAIVMGDDDAEAEDLIQGSQDYDASATYVLYGTLAAKIVGVRYYRGNATIGEHVILTRQPQNQYDRNAIRVDNVMGHQIGHIPRYTAAKLAKYMDSGALVVEGVLTGIIGTYDCPINLHLLGPGDPVRRQKLTQELVSERLPLAALKRLEREEMASQKEHEKAQKRAEKNARAAASKREQPTDTMFANLHYPAQGEIEAESLDNLVDQSSTFNPRDIGQVTESFGVSEADLANMPMADTPSALVTELLPYQRQGLAWMMDQESPSLPAAGSDDMVQLWKRKGSLFTNIATNFSTAHPPPLASGGILADDMGLGKTIQVISLILANSTPKTSGFSATTLIVSPVGVMSNWKNQVNDHTKEDCSPRVLIYHGAGKKEAAKLAEYDVVITSYGALASEFNPNAKKPPATGIFSMHWRRVVLDEGHTIRNPRSKGALSAYNLRADSRWTLTGTPIINSLKDLYSQVRLLKLSGGLEDMSVFNSVLTRPLTYNDSDARLLLQALMSTICLRRRKDMNFVNLKLPPITSRVLRVKFHPHEQEKYDMFQSEAKGVLLDYKSRDKQANASYSHVLEVLLRMRQVCNHWALCKDRIDNLAGLLDKHKIVPLTPENIKALQEMLQIRIESQEMCPICLDNLEQPVITACGHSFDRDCIEQVIERQHKCPLCRAEIENTSTLVSPAVETDEYTNPVQADSNNPSSKIEALLKILTAQGQSAGTKSVVFSQWTSFLNLVEPHLERHGIGFARIDGKMNSVKRDYSINAFSNDPNCTVLLASLNVCSVGINLVAANQAILADSWWAPAIEDQAVDRVYRLGQKRDTNVWRLVMEGSIEDRVLQVQETKRELMLAAFHETSKKKAEDRATRVADLERLLS